VLIIYVITIVKLYLYYHRSSLVILLLETCKTAREVILFNDSCLITYTDLERKHT